MGVKVTKYLTKNESFFINYSSLTEENKKNYTFKPHGAQVH